MAIIWKINGDTPATLGVENLTLRLGNQVADVFTFEQPGAMDAEALFAVGDEIVLTRQVDAGSPVTFFRGYLRRLPRRSKVSAEQITYEARGGWDLLERRAYLQSFREPVDASNPESVLASVLRGRVVLSQDDAGAKVSVNDVVASAIGFAIGSGAPLQAGTINVGGMEIPWDETTDLSCADAISRALQWRPDVVVWFDYTFEPPKMMCRPRAALTPIEFAVRPQGDVVDEDAYAPLDSVLINPRHDLVCENVCLIYVATNRANEATWESTERDVYPPGTTGREENALVRTIQLAGRVYQSTILEQKIQTRAFTPATLGFGDGPLTSGGTFDSLRDFWRRHNTALQSSAVVIKSFRAGTFGAADPDEGFNTVCVRELEQGAITDWMEDFQGIVTQQVQTTADIEIEITDPATTKKERKVIKASAVMTATNASNTLYTFLASDSFTPAESAPGGLAQDLQEALSPLQYDGSIVLLEEECTAAAKVGNTVNLTGALAAWGTMAALVQQVELSIDDGRTLISVGPPRQLGPDDLVEIYRTNRNRQPTTSYMTRTSGKTGSAAQKQSLSKHHPVKPGSPPISTAARIYTTDVA